MINHWLLLHNNTTIMVTPFGSTSLTSIKLNKSNAYFEQLCTTYPSIIEVQVTTSLTKLWSNASRTNPNTHVQHKNGPTHFALPNSNQKIQNPSSKPSNEPIPPLKLHKIARTPWAQKRSSGNLFQRILEPFDKKMKTP